MKLFKKSMLFFGMLSLSINGVSQDTINKALPAAVLQIAARFAPPAHIQKLIDENRETILALPDDGQVYMLETSPKLYVKASQFDRVMNAYRMQNFLTKNNISTITVPKKYASKVGYKFMVFVEGVDVEEVTSIDLQEMKDLISFIEGTGYCDLHAGNLKRDKTTGKLIIIDTETRSFCQVRVDCFDVFYDYFGSILTPEALTELERYCKKYYQTCLCEDTQYDGDIDFSVVQDYIEDQTR